MTDLQPLIDQLPECLSHSSQAHCLPQLRHRLALLARQGLALSVREWFEEHPEIDQPFEVHMDSIHKIRPRNGEEMDAPLREAVQDLCDRLMLHNPFGDMETPTRLVLLMNGLKWDRSQVDNILQAILTVESQGLGPTGWEVLAAADQAKLDRKTDPSSGQVGKPRL